LLSKTDALRFGQISKEYGRPNRILEVSIKKTSDDRTVKLFACRFGKDSDDVRSVAFISGE
jgi:hypothetical protein